MGRLLFCTSVMFCVLVGDAAAQQSTGPAGGGQPHGNVQPSLALNALIRTDGSVFEKLGEIKFFAGNFAPAGYRFANGQLLASAQQPGLTRRGGQLALLAEMAGPPADGEVEVRFSDLKLYALAP